ncbi:Protein sey1, partial [Frankliniella fusca]
MPEVSLVLDAEFLFLLSLLRPVFAALSPELRDQARAWLERLCQVPAQVDSARRDRNEYLSRLYHGMMANKLDAVFLDVPPEGALRPPHEVFTAVDLESWLSDTASDADAARPREGRGDADERTYLATKVLPGGRGAFGYLAVSLAKGGPHWVSGDRGAGSWRPGDPQATSTPLLQPPAAQDLSPLEARLGARPGAEQRQQLLDFYDSLIRDLDQAVAEPDKTSPELEKLISSFQVSAGHLSLRELASGVVMAAAASCLCLQDSSASVAEEAVPSARQVELLAQLRGRLEERRERAARRSALLDTLEESAGATPPPAPSSSRGTPPRRAQDEDDVWSIKPENVTLLEAAYPRELVRRFLDAIVRERVAVLGRVRAHRHLQQRVEGQEDVAAEDMEHYRDATAAWAGVLRSLSASGPVLGSAQGRAAVDAAAGQAERCADLAATATARIRELGAARATYFENEERYREQQVSVEAKARRSQPQHQGLQPAAAALLPRPYLPACLHLQVRVKAEIEVLRAEEAVLKRRLQQQVERR